MVVTGVLHWKQVSFNINSNWQVRQEMVDSCIEVKRCKMDGVMRL